jgi:hypothetical protein
MAPVNPSGTRTAYPAESRTAASTTTRTEKGLSLARGPALILGTVLLVAGLYLLYKAHTFPPFSNFPNGHAPKDGNFFFGLFGANGWTGMLTAAGGGLLLFGAAQHLLAKTMSLIVGIALGAAAVIALFNHGNVLGMAAANGWTELAWGACAVILLFNTLVPRRRRTVQVVNEPVAPAYAQQPAYEERPAARRAETVDEPTAERRAPADEAGEGTAVHQSAAGTDADTEEPTVVQRGDEPAAVRRDEAATTAERPVD